MSKTTTKKAVSEIIKTGYRHRAYEKEKEVLRRLILGEMDDGELIRQYLAPCKEMLGPTPIRALKNGLICLLTTLSRTAIEYGAESDYCFALSDYYINMVESCNREDMLKDAYHEIIESYREAVDENTCAQYSSAIVDAVRIMRRSLYSRVKICDIADELGMTSEHFSRKFKEETGKSPYAFIEEMKMEEAKLILQQNELHINEIAELLGYCSPGQFSKRFRICCGMTPLEYREDAALSIWASSNFC